MTVRTRFAPSPTGYLHLGGARTALFAWAYARRFGGTFILRIEDTDLERSTPEAVQAIIDGMQWLGLNHDEGPFYQMQRMDRYKVVIQEMLAAGSAYPCYATPEELEAMRAEQMARNEKPRYDGRWRPEPGKELPVVPVGAKPVIRFRNPTDGVVAWDDLVKGRIEISNRELDDLIIARADGTPTYNFCVVVDDWDMGITQVIRGDDHVNNTPRQINILQALGAPPLSDDAIARWLLREGPGHPRGQHLVFVQMESWSAEPLMYQSSRLDVAGTLAPLMEKAWHFRNFDAAHIGTHPSLETLLLGTPITPITTGQYRHIPFEWSVARVLQRAGYDTLFVTSGHTGWRELNRVLPTQGFDEVVDAATLRERAWIVAACLSSAWPSRARNSPLSSCFIGTWKPFFDCIR